MMIRNNIRGKLLFQLIIKIFLAVITGNKMPTLANYVLRMPFGVDNIVATNSAYRNISFVNNFYNMKP